MRKVSAPLSNNFCPQTLFLYGTYRKDGTPNFGLFCWFSYCWDGELTVMASIGGGKLTKDRIHETGVFSAGLVTTEVLPLADKLGSTDGYTEAKRVIPLETEPGKVLNVPILAQCPWTYELEVKKTVVLDDSEVYFCKIRNILADEALMDEGESIAARMDRINPACTTYQTYFDFHGNRLGAWGDFVKG